MNIEVHAPSQLALVVGVLAALIALVLYFLPGTNVHYAFWLMTAAYVVSAVCTENLIWVDAVRESHNLTR